MDDGARDELPQVVGPIASVIKLRRGGAMKTEPEMNEKKQHDNKVSMREPR